jgi:hypothetical protein
MVLTKRNIAWLLVACSTVCFGFIAATSIIPDSHAKIISRNIKKLYNDKSAYLDFTAQQLDSSAKGSGCLVPIKSNAAETMGFLGYRKANACYFGGCTDTLCEAPDQGWREYIYYYVIMDSASNIEKITVLEYESSYGYEISNRGWLKQFYNKKPGKFKLSQNIDGISGATVSVNAMIDDINSLKLANQH